MTFGACARNDENCRLANRPGLRDWTRRALRGQSRARRARSLVVAVMRIRAALLGVGDHARLVAGEREIRAEKSQLTEDGKQRREQTQARQRSSSHGKSTIH